MTGFAPHSTIQSTLEPVAIVSVDTQKRMAKGLTRLRTILQINCMYPVGGIYSMPAEGDQWYVERLDNAYWKLSSRIPFNDNNTLIEPVQGQTVIGGTGPVALNGSQVDIYGDTNINGALTVGDTQIRGDGGNLEQSSDGGETWNPVGTGAATGPGGIEDVTGLTDALAAKLDKPTTPVTPGTGSLITYDENGLVTAGDNASITDITGLQDALDTKAPINHTHEGTGGTALPLTTKGDLLTWVTDLVRKPVGDDNTWLKADAAQTDGLLWDFITEGDVVGLTPHLEDMQTDIDAKQGLGSILQPFQIPGLDCSKIISGLFPPGMIPGIDANKIISGSFLSTLIPGLDASKIISGSFLSGLIPGLDATKIISGIFPTGFIPNLDASKIGSGQFLAGLIPSLDATKIVSGILGLAQIPGLDTTRIPVLDASKIGSGSFLSSLIPGLDATKITSGIFGLGQIPSLDLSKIPLLDLTKIPGLPASQITSGQFLTGLIPGLDVSKIISGIFPVPRIPALDATQITTGTFPQNMITNLATNLSSIFGTITSPTAPALLQNVPLSSIGQVNPEMLVNPGYDSLGSVSGGTSGWSWDPAVSHTAGGSGSARVSANGTILQLLSDPPIPVSPNQQLAVSHWLQWSGLVGSGICFTLSVNAYAGLGISNTVDIQSITSPAASSGWVQLSGTYTVPASGVDNIRLVLTVTSGVTAGTVWWDDGSVKKTQLLRQDWTSGLIGDINNLLSGVNARTLITDTTSLMSTLGMGTPTLTAIGNRLTNLGSAGGFDAAWLGNIIGIPMVSNSRVSGVGAANIGTSMQETWNVVSGQALGSLSQITSRLTNLSTGGQFNAGSLFNLLGIGGTGVLPPATIPALDGSIIQSGIVPFAQLPVTQFNRTTLPDLGDFLDQVTNAWVGNSDPTNQFAGTAPPDARESMDHMYKEFLGLSQKMQDIRSSQIATDVSGKTVTVNFAEMPDGPAPSNFTVTISGAGTSAWGIKSGGVGWRTQVNDGNRTALAVYNIEKTNTDFQIVRGTLSGAPPQNANKPMIYGIGRVDSYSNPRNYVWARGYCVGFLKYQGDVGCTINGVDTVWFSAIPLTWSMDINLIIGVGGNPRRYQVFSGTELVKDFIEPGTASLIGPNYRYWGCRSEIKAGVAPPFIVGTSVSDNQPPAVVGSTFRAYRASTGDVTFSGTTTAPANFFDTPQYRSAEMGWDGTSLTIGIEGTYLVNIRYKTPSIPGGGKADVALAQTGIGLARLMGGGFADSSFGANSGTGIFGSALVYCKVNDVLTPGYAVTNNVTADGETTGAATYFEVTLVNRSTA